MNNQGGQPTDRDYCTTKRLMNELDVNGDGIIKLEEYRFALGLTDTPSAEWKRLFAMLDQDRSGTVSVAEIRELFSEVGLSYSTSLIEDWIRECDVNSDGSVNYKEFLGFVAEHLC
ncbi:hypothetical protein CRM22_006023 [Opisthorchis felineus]|uniref:EF-hand domain-containing protein n=1 Tax=Opisthorchis felineus TaxID=147828 RepID=A0A4S2LN39_OPIFE|nr:hypothetical protein CRM22_006023 [Opisthorchis felineus]TGZ65113.1 hypothetical protein CRM22_006023 [Opisthorchis felineus]